MNVTVASEPFIAMPEPAPLPVRVQDFSRCGRNRDSNGQSGTDHSFRWRLAVFLPALAGTLLLLHGLYKWLSDMGMSGIEWALLAMIGLTFVWVTLSVSTMGVAIAGLLVHAREGTDDEVKIDGIDVALLVPIYNEPTSDVFGNAAAMLEDLARRGTKHRYAIFILSDTRDPHIAEQERRAFWLLRHNAPDGIKVYYRRRAENTDKKVGNLIDWINGWGAAYEGMVVLDADSLMSGRAIEQLTDVLARDDRAGLIQTCPMLIGADTLFARQQQFSNIAYGWLLAEGLANWSGTEGNYWGHNAIIRTRAFASSAVLPHLKGRKGRSELIYSHDFVEAGLLRRAGWRVRFLPRLSGSFEETPGTLIDYVLRDRRWCRGNLQHLRLLGTAGLHPVSRFHLLHGAVSYLLSPAWFALLVVWFLLGKDSETNVVRYFNEANPLFPDWPPSMSHIESAVFLVIMYALLLMPKLVGAGIIACHRKATRLYGGRRAFLSAFVVEIALSIAFAPIMMVQQSKAVVAAATGRALDWVPQRRSARAYSLSQLMQFHWLEIVLGGILLAGLASGLVSLWLLPIAGSLLLAVPLSALSALPVARFLTPALAMQSPITLREPAIVTAARNKRGWMQQLLSGSVLPAE